MIIRKLGEIVSTAQMIEKNPKLIRVINQKHIPSLTVSCLRKQQCHCS